MSFNAGPVTANAFSGVLPVANGGTGVATASFQSTVLPADVPAITENTTLADIPDLLITLAASETWFFRAQIFATAASGNPGFKFAVHGTEAATSIRYQSIGNDGGLYPLSMSAHYQSAYDVAVTNVSTAGVNTFTFEGVITNGAAASVVTIQIAQNASHTDAIQVKAGSNISARRAS